MTPKSQIEVVITEISNLYKIKFCIYLFFNDIWISLKMYRFFSDIIILIKKWVMCAIIYDNSDKWATYIAQYFEKHQLISKATILNKGKG